MIGSLRNLIGALLVNAGMAVMNDHGRSTFGNCILTAAERSGLRIIVVPDPPSS